MITYHKDLIQGSDEVWRELASFPDYAVSDLGQVKRIKQDRRNHKVSGVCLKVASAPGRKYPSLSLCWQGKAISVRVNRLVCEAAEMVQAIRADPRPQRAIGAAFGVTQRVVWSVKARKTWGHVE